MNILKTPDGCIILSPELNEDTKLYRYVPFNRFIDFVESKQTSLSRIKEWEDTWEVPSTRVPIQIDDGPIRQDHWHFGELMYGQCWSLHEESDAMWRIYSLQKQGVVIQTSVKKFALLIDIQHAALGSVFYYDDIKQAMQITRELRYERFSEAFVKRRAFEHEKEVRFVTAADSYCFGGTLPSEGSRLTVDLDPVEFIEGIKVNPRADDQHVKVLQQYCARSGLMCIPTKSMLYGDLYKQTGLVIKYVTVNKSAKRNP